MSVGLSALCESAAQLLRYSGLEAVAAFEPDLRRQWDGPVAAVSLSGVTCLPVGLGVREGADIGGREVEITLTVAVFAPRDGGACVQGAEEAAEALLRFGVGGLEARELEWGPVEWLDRAGLYRLPLKCCCRGWLLPAAEDGGVFDDFEVKGSQT